jgi:type I restriction enzyme S subunit
MAIEWPLTTIGEHVELLTGEAFKSSGFTDSGVRLARGDNVKEGEFEWGEKTRCWPTVTPDLERYLLRDGDVLLGMDGSKVGKNWVQVRSKDLPCLLVQRVARLRGKETLDQGYLRFLIGNPAFRDYVHRVRTGTSIPHISGGQIKSYQISLPPLPEQKRIADILGALDDKIDLNRRMNATLEGILRAIFKSWFVDFDPVRQKAAGKQPAGIDAQTAALFPDSFEDSRIGEVPKGWTATVLEDVLEEIETGGRPKGGVAAYSSGVPSIGAESIVGLGEFDYAKTKFVPRDFYEKMKKGRVRSRDVLLYKDGGRPGQFEPHVTLFGDGFPFDECAINEHVYRLRARPDFGQALLFCWLSSDLVMDEMRVKGTGVAIPGLNSTQARSLTTLRPPVEIALAFDGCVEPAVAGILSACKESRHLAVVRDTLVPKLLSGEIRVAEAEEAVVEALG